MLTKLMFTKCSYVSPISLFPLIYFTNVHSFSIMSTNFDNFTNFTHLHEKVNRLGFTNSGLCFLDFVKIVCQSALSVQSLDFSGNMGTKSCFVNLPVPFRPSGYMSHMRSCEDENHMDF